MSHAADWRCRSEACRTLLGQVRDGALRPRVPVESIDGRGVAQFRCPGCGTARCWFPSRAAAAERRPADRPD